MCVCVRACARVYLCVSKLGYIPLVIMDQNHVDVTKMSTEIYEYLRYSQRSSSQISLNTSASFETRNISNDLLKFMKLRIGIGSLQKIKWNK